MTLTSLGIPSRKTNSFQMPVRSMTLTSDRAVVVGSAMFQMPVRSMTLTRIGARGLGKT